MPDPISQAIDAYMEMEAKARAWDLLTQAVAAVPDGSIESRQLLDEMARLVQSARANV